MKKWVRLGAAVLILTLCAVFGRLLLKCMKPMEDRVYDLSLTWEGEAIPEGWVYDQKGWMVFVQEGETMTELTPDGFGDFFGPVEPGQTFYFSRVIEEDLDAPTLRLERANRTFAVFLDGDLLYTDCPELADGIGELRLPPLEWYEQEPLLVTLPRDYAGKVLTIAQSTDLFPEREGSVWPCSVTLYCGYAYESGLIADSFQTAIPAALAFAAGALLLALFAVQVLRDKPDLGVLCGGLTALFWMAGRLAFLPNVPLEPLPVDTAGLVRNFSLTLLLIFLASRLTLWRRVLLGLFAGVQGSISAAAVAAEITQHLTIPLMLMIPWAGLAGLTAAWLLGLIEWKKSWFFRCFCPLAAAGAVLLAVLGLWQFDGRSPGMLLQPLAGIMTAAALAAALAEAVRRKAARRTEARLLAQRGELAQSSYEVLRRQHEQVMMLRHDMMKHFQVLRQTTADEKTAAYLDELIGENEKIRPVVQSGNEMLDVILNGKLSAANHAGVSVELVRTKAPEKLSLTDSELCSLVINLLDNALEAAAAPGVKRRYLKLDMNVRKGYFVFTCENGATLDWINKETAPERGLGLKVVRQIVERYGNLYNTEYGDGYYRVTVLLPLCQPRK